MCNKILQFLLYISILLLFCILFVISYIKNNEGINLLCICFLIIIFILFIKISDTLNLICYKSDENENNL